MISRTRNNMDVQGALPDRSYQPEAQYISQMDRYRLLQLLKASFCKLSGSERKLLYKRFYQNKKLHEIAKELSLPDKEKAGGRSHCKDVSTISKEIKRALDKLQRYFHKENIHSIHDLLS